MVEIRDFTTAPCDGQGQLIGQSCPGPFKLAFFLAAMPRVLEKCRGAFEPGGGIGVNDPYAGHAHARRGNPGPCILVRQAGRFHADVFAPPTSTGASLEASATELFEEGLRLPVMKLYRGGQRNDHAWEIGSQVAPNGISGGVDGVFNQDARIQDRESSKILLYVILECQG